MSEWFFLSIQDTQHNVFADDQSRPTKRQRLFLEKREVLAYELFTAEYSAGNVLEMRMDHQDRSVTARTSTNQTQSVRVCRTEVQKRKNLQNIDLIIH